MTNQERYVEGVPEFQRIEPGVSSNQAGYFLIFSIGNLEFRRFYVNRKYAEMFEQRLKKLKAWDSKLTVPIE